MKRVSKVGLFDFKNLSQSSCKKITFLRVDIDDNIEDYKGALKELFL